MPQKSSLLAAFTIALAMASAATAEPRGGETGRHGWDAGDRHPDERRDGRGRHGRRANESDGYPPFAGGSGSYPNGSYGNPYGGSWNGDWNDGGRRNSPPPPSPRGAHDGLWYY